LALKLNIQILTNDAKMIMCGKKSKRYKAISLKELLALISKTNNDLALKF
jgi:hypothetical protein